MKNYPVASRSNGLDVVIVRSVEGIEAIRETWERLQSEESYPKINADIDRYLTIHMTVRDDAEPYIMLVKEHGRPCTMLIGLIGKDRLRCSVARMTLFAPELKWLMVVYGGIIGRVTTEIYRLMVGELIKVLNRGDADVVSFQKLKKDSELYHVAQTMPGLFSRDYFPKVEKRWLLSIPGHIENFWKACSHNRRKQLRKYTRRLEDKYPGQVKMIRYSQLEEVAEGLSIAADISENTYQRAFGSGLVNDGATRAHFEAEVKKDWLRLYILFISGEPCAFLYTLKYGRTCFAEHTAYSPKWKDWNVGSIIHLRVVEQLCCDPDVDTLDFGSGDVQHKRLGDCRQLREATVFIFASRPFPIFVNMIRLTTLAMTVLSNRVITGLGIKNLVQRYRRRRIVHKSAREQETDGYSIDD